MKRRISTLEIAALLGLGILSFAAACAKKTPTTTQEARPPVSAAKPAETPVPPPPKAAPTTDETVDITVMDIETINRKGYLTDAFFDFDQSDLREDARSALATDAQWLKKHGSVQVLIEGQ